MKYITWKLLIGNYGGTQLYLNSSSCLSLVDLTNTFRHFKTCFEVIFRTPCMLFYQFWCQNFNILIFSRVCQLFCAPGLAAGFWWISILWKSACFFWENHKHLKPSKTSVTIVRWICVLIQKKHLFFEKDDFSRFSVRFSIFFNFQSQIFEKKFRLEFRLFFEKVSQKCSDVRLI